MLPLEERRKARRLRKAREGGASDEEIGKLEASLDQKSSAKASKQAKGKGGKKAAKEPDPAPSTDPAKTETPTNNGWQANT